MSYQLKRFLDSIFRNEGKKLKSLNYIFCSDKELLKINIDFLNHDYFTDIITFDLSEKDGIVGEIYISLERVRENVLIDSCLVTWGIWSDYGI